MTVVLVAHGGEAVAKGGPTTRLAALQSACESAGHRVIRIADCRALADDIAADIIHVFNAWPVESAVAQLMEARARGAVIVFSPIALDLRHQMHFQRAMPALLEQAVSEKQVRYGARAMRRLTPPWFFDREDAPPPAEGTPSHFAGLRAAVELADHVIYLSTYEKAFLEAVSAPARASTLIRNGVDVTTFSPDAAQTLAASFGFDRFVLNVGRIEARKNQALLAAAARAADAPLVCVGAVAESAYFELVKRWAPQQFLHIERLEDRALLAGVYAGAAAFALPSWTEGAPLTALEAGAAGAPLILSSMSGEKEYFEGLARYRHPADLEGLTADILAAMNAPETLNARAERAAHISGRFSMDRHIRETLSLYERLYAEQGYARMAPRGPNRIQVATVRATRPQTAFFKTAARPEETARALTLEAFADLPDLLGLAAVTDHVCKDVMLRLSPSIHEAGSEPLIATVRRLGAKRALFSGVKQAINTLPPRFHRLAEGLVRRIAPDFNTVVANEHRLLRTCAVIGGIQILTEAAAQVRRLPTVEYIGADIVIAAPAEKLDMCALAVLGALRAALFCRLIVIVTDAPAGRKLAAGVETALEQTVQTADAVWVRGAEGRAPSRQMLRSAAAAGVLRFAPAGVSDEELAKIASAAQ